MKNAFVLNDNSTFEMAVEAIDEGGMGFVAVIDESGFLLGILTDGDIRRAFLKKSYLLGDIINKSPEVMSEGTSHQAIIAKLKSLHRRHMPLVDSNGILKSVFSLDEVEFVSRENPVVIMAGGLGTRLGELTKNTPKPMLEVGNRPMLQNLVELFREQGFRKFIFCVNYKKEVIKNYFQSGQQFGIEISYVEENTRLGTAGALSLIKSPMSQAFFVINADILTSLDFVKFLDFHLDKNSVATMCVKEYSHKVPFGVVNSDVNDNILSFEEKPELKFNVNAGIYLLSPGVLTFVPSGEFFDMPSLFDNLRSQGVDTYTYQVDDYWVDIGRKEDLLQADYDLKKH